MKFAPYLEDSYKAVVELLDYPSADTRRAAVTSVTMLCRAVWQLPSRAYSSASAHLFFSVLFLNTCVFSAFAKLAVNKCVLIVEHNCALLKWEFLHARCPSVCTKLTMSKR